MSCSGENITLSEASNLTRQWQTNNPNARSIAFCFEKQKVLNVLNGAGAAGLRVYLGQDAGGEIELVLVGVDAGGNDLTANDMLDRGFPCPPCGSPNDLNHDA